MKRIRERNFLWTGMILLIIVFSLKIFSKSSTDTAIFVSAATNSAAIDKAAGTAASAPSTSKIQKTATGVSTIISNDYLILNLNNPIKSPIVKDTEGCYTLSQSAEKVTFTLSGPTNKTLETVGSDRPMTYCCNFVIKDLSAGTYNLSIEVTRTGSINNTDNKTLEISKPSLLETNAQKTDFILQSRCPVLNIKDLDECKNTIVDQYAKNIKCQDLNDADCKASLKKTYSNNLIVLEDKYKRIKENIGGYMGKDANVTDLENIINRGTSTPDVSIPIQMKSSIVKVLKANESIVLDKAQGIIQGAPFAVAIDTDSDGIPDDIEKRIGTDPGKMDTDGDGYSDSEEILNGYDPVGPGKKAIKLYPIEKIIINNLALDHPKTSGIESENFAVSKIANIADEKEASAQSRANGGYVISGVAKAYSVATVYIYSDIPVISTVATDSNGNWQYELDQPLSDGDHEIYVALNDETGKIVNKSKPLDFTVRQAKAISPSPDIASAKKVSEIKQTSSAVKTDSSMKYYAVSFASILIIFGIAVFIFKVLRNKNKLNQ